MAISWSLDSANGKFTIEQIASRPTVYLDNWAYQLLINDSSRGTLFIDLLNNLSGTLAVSAVSLLEVVRRTDIKQIKKILELIDSVDGVFIEFNPSKVIKREKLSRGYNQTSPAADIDLLEAYILHAHDPGKPFKLSEAFNAYLNYLGETGTEFRERFEETLNPIINKARDDPGLLLKAKKRFERKGNITFPCTEYLYEKCIDFIVINSTMKMSNAEWRDVFHLIVSVSYCDFVIIDSRWVQFVKQTGLNPPNIATIYNKSGFDKFLSDLNNFTK